MSSVDDALGKVRKACERRGAAGIKTFGRMFRIYDDDGNKALSINEFQKGLRDYGVDLSNDELIDLFSHFDKDGSGSLIFDEFLKALRPAMSQARVKLIERAFNILDVTGDNVVTVEDLKGRYDVSQHPKYKSGEMTRKQVLEQFLKNFEVDDKVDGVVTREEFLNYYSGVSASIDLDVYFDYMMRQSWKGL